MKCNCQNKIQFELRKALGSFLLFLAIFSSTSFGQDIHFSIFEMSPLNLNPGGTGDFIGDYRFNANHRSQWRSVTVPYSTFSASADMKNFLKKKFLSSGIQINQDRAGDSRFNTFQLNWSNAYHYKLKSDTLKKLTFALQTGFTNRNLAYDDLRFDAQYNGYQYVSSASNQESFTRDSRTYLNLNTGILYSQTLKEEHELRVGVSLFNLARNKQSFYDDQTIRLDMRVNLNASLDWQINEKFAAIPALLLMRQGTFTSFNIGGNVRYTLVDFAGIYRAVWGGVFYRNRDATYISVGFDYDQWKIGLSYDVNISTLTPASNYRGSFEIALQYIINKTPFKRVMHRICPDYL